MKIKRKYQKKSLSFFEQLGYENDIYKMSYSKLGPNKQFVYGLRFPITYKNIQLISQRVDFSNYFDWMGQVREYSLRPIMKKILKLTKKGDWGLATNSVKLKVFNYLFADDVVEARLWLDRISGHDNIYHLAFDWYKYLGFNAFECVASSSVIITCVKIIDHGVAVIEKPPLFFKKFLNIMKPQSNDKKVLSFDRPRINLGRIIKDYSQRPKYISKQEYKTTLENSNLIGNIYFSNYSKWINATKDTFLYIKKPNLFNKTMANSEFFTFEINISHLQEAMPFDQILVRMYVSEVYEKGVSLKYEVFKKVKNSFSVRLALAKQLIGFSNRFASKPQLEKIPPDVIDIF